MIRPERAVGTGARAPVTRQHSIRRLLAAPLAVLLGLAALAVTAPSASASVTTSQGVARECRLTASAPIVGTVADETSTDTQFRQVTGPAELKRGEVGQYRVTSPFHFVPDSIEQGGMTVSMSRIENIQEVFRVPAGLEIVGASLGTNGNIGNGSISRSGQDVTVTFPGNYGPNVVHNPPDIVLEVRAVGLSGTVGTIEHVSNRYTFIGSVTILVSLTVTIHNVCQRNPAVPAPPNGIIRSIPIVPGPYVQPPPPPSSEAGTVNTTCSFNFNGTNVNNQAVNVPVTVTPASLDSEGNPTGPALIQPGPFDWRGRANALTASNRRVQNARNVGMQIQVNGAEVASVTAGSGATASYNAGTGVITYLSTATHSGTFTPPAITVNLAQPVSPGASFAVVGHSFDYQTESQSLGIFWGSATWRNTACTVASSPTFTAAQTNVVATWAAADLDVTVANNSSIGIDLIGESTPGPVPANPASVYIATPPQHGSLTIDPATGIATYTPVAGTPERSDSFTYLFNDVEGWTTNLATVQISIVGLFCVAGQPGEPAEGCSLDQFIEFDVVGDPLAMSQTGPNVSLETITLDGEAQPTTGLMNELTVLNRRGDGQAWSITGQVTDFKAEGYEADCPASNPSTWNWQCIPGDNLGWAPLASVGHDWVPGDVATVSAGSTIESGLSSDAQSLCLTVPTTSGGTFTCGAVLTLVTPASAAARVYQATLTLTLA